VERRRGILKGMRARVRERAAGLGERVTRGTEEGEGKEGRGRHKQGWEGDQNRCEVGICGSGDTRLGRHIGL